MKYGSRIRPTQRQRDDKSLHTNGKGQGNGPRMTDEQAAECAKRLSRFESPKSIAKDLGYTVQAIKAAAARHKAEQVAA